MNADSNSPDPAGASPSEEEYEQFARAAGAALRRPAPHDAIERLQHARRRRQLARASIVGACVLLVGIGVAVFTRLPGNAIVPSDSTITTITQTDVTAPTPVTTVTPSTTATSKPVGKIAFRSNNDGQIYVMNADGTDQTRLITNKLEFANENGGPSWSPDGSRIAFDSGTVTNSQISVMNADGTDQTRLTNIAANNWGPLWSPDGTRIVFQSGTAPDSEGNSISDIWVMNADGTGQTRLTDNTGVNAYFPSWSPDGTRIAFWSEGIWVMNADGTSKTRLADSGVAAPLWSPDGAKIIFAHQNGGAWGIWVMNADGTDQTPLIEDGWGALWSPDGTTIVFTSQAAGNDANVWVINADGTNQIRLTNFTHLGAAPDAPVPLWSLDGTMIAFTRLNASNLQYENEVWVMNADGTGQTRVAAGTVLSWIPE